MFKALGVWLLYVTCLSLAVVGLAWAGTQSDLIRFACAALVVVLGIGSTLLLSRSEVRS